MRQKELEERKKNLEILISKKAEREKRQIRIRAIKQIPKKMKDENYNEDNQVEKAFKLSKVTNLKMLQSIEMQKDKPTLPYVTLKSEKSKVDLSTEGNLITRGTHTLEPLKDVSDAKTNRKFF